MFFTDEETLFDESVGLLDLEESADSGKKNV